MGAPLVIQDLTLWQVFQEMESLQTVMALSELENRKGQKLREGVILEKVYCIMPENEPTNYVTQEVA